MRVSVSSRGSEREGRRQIERDREREGGGEREKYCADVCRPVDVAAQVGRVTEFSEGSSVVWPRTFGETTVLSGALWWGVNSQG